MAATGGYYFPGLRPMTSMTNIIPITSLWYKYLKKNEE